MLDILAYACNDGGRLVGATYTLFAGDPGDHSFVTAVALRFEYLTAVFRAVPEDDTLAAFVGTLAAEPDEVVADLGAEQPWSSCLGLGVRWAWRLTNHQGYTDGVRLEFGAPGELSRAVVELVVFASGIQIFEAAEAKARRTIRCSRPGPL